jgi:hypothetical protein
MLLTGNNQLFFWLFQPLCPNGIRHAYSQQLSVSYQEVPRDADVGATTAKDPRMIDSF